MGRQPGPDPGRAAAGAGRRAACAPAWPGRRGPGRHRPPAPSRRPHVSRRHRPHVPGPTPPAMSTRITDSVLYQHLWGTAESRAVLGEEGRLRGWLEVIVALARAQAAVGVIPSY